MQFIFVGEPLKVPTSTLNCCPAVGVLFAVYELKLLVDEALISDVDAEPFPNWTFAVPASVLHLTPLSVSPIFTCCNGMVVVAPNRGANVPAPVVVPVSVKEGWMTLERVPAEPPMFAPTVPVDVNALLLVSVEVAALERFPFAFTYTD